MTMSTRRAHNFIDATGQRFGRLAVIERVRKEGENQSYWRCRCDCGGSTVTTITKLRSGHSKSCGCHRSESFQDHSTVHGMARHEHRHPLANTYFKMVARCHHRKSADFEDYGKRGIVVCDRWLNGEGDLSGIECFVLDMGLRPTKRHSINRRDNDGPYSPDNCNWATPQEQARNRRSTARFQFRGEELSTFEISNITGLPAKAILDRMKKGWDIERAATQPLRLRGVSL